MTMENDAKKCTGSCFCGEVQLEVTGDPEEMGYCHCNSCRHWSAGPVNAFTLWMPENVHITKGKSNIKSYNKTPDSTRMWCMACGGHIMTDHPSMGLIDVYAAVIPDVPFTPRMHVHYQETVLPMKDGLKKFKDLPREAGGSGEEIPE